MAFDKGFVATWLMSLLLSLNFPPTSPDNLDNKAIRVELFFIYFQSAAGHPCLAWLDCTISHSNLSLSRKQREPHSDPFTYFNSLFI